MARALTGAAVVGAAPARAVLLASLALAVVALPPAATRAAEEGSEDERLEAPRPAPRSAADRDYRRTLFELGIFGGLFVPSDSHELYEFGEATHKPLQNAPELGLRFGVLPHRNFGLEADLALMPARTEDEGLATLYAARAGVVGQLPNLLADGLTPFATLGLGTLGVFSEPEVLGRDGDPELHLGVGARYKLSRNFDVRLDLRHLFADAVDAGGSDDSAAGHNELLLGLSFMIGRPAPVPPDPDGDGIRGKRDECPDVPGVKPDGCPDPDPDRDGVAGDADRCPDEAAATPDGCPDHDPDRDGVLGAADRCPAEAGPAPDGCPPVDLDHDGFLGDADRCPDQAGVAPDGCPADPDPDRDGILGEADLCPAEPETVNLWQDEDGCPDQIPAEVAPLVGEKPELRFDAGKAKITEKSRPLLDRTVKLLKEQPALRLEVTCQAGDAKDPARNGALAVERAEAIKKYLVLSGIAADRLDAKAGPDLPPPPGEQQKVLFRPSSK